MSGSIWIIVSPHFYPDADNSIYPASYVFKPKCMQVSFKTMVDVAEFIIEAVAASVLFLIYLLII